MEKLLRVEEVAELLRIAPVTIWRRVKDGTLPEPLRIAGVSRWRPSDLRAALDAVRENPRPLKRVPIRGRAAS